ncbi:MAG: S8 family serine peptidase [Actinomycetes bacterium]
MTTSIAARGRRTRHPAIVFSLLSALAASVTALPAPSPNVVRSSGGAVTAQSATPASVDPAVLAALDSAPTAGVIVRTSSAAAAAGAARAVAAAGGEVGALLPIVDGFSATIDAEVLASLRARPGVLEIAADGSVTLDHTYEPGTYVGDSEFVEHVRADVLHRAGVDGSGVGIAVIDTGVTEVADLAGRVVGGLDLSGEGDGVDRMGHGTFIAGVAAGNGAASAGQHAGVAPGAHVVPVKIAGENGAADVSHVLAAIQYVVSFKDTYGIGVLNLSLGTDSTQPNALSPLNHAVQRAWDAGIVVVVSAGNHGAEGPGRIPKPADDPLVITVGATDRNGTPGRGDDTVAPYSSRGPSIADGVVKPDLVAPGSHLVGLRAPGSGVDRYATSAHVGSAYVRGSGTSFAAAVTTGAVALLRQAHPDWTPDQIKGALTTTAARGPVRDRNVDGHGVVDVAAAAALTAPPVANQGVQRSSGLGSLAADRGSLVYRLQVSPLLPAVRLDNTTELTAQNQLFDPLSYVSSDWSAGNWYAGNWYAGNWYAGNWYAGNWYAGNWY